MADCCVDMTAGSYVTTGVLHHGGLWFVDRGTYAGRFCNRRTNQLIKYFDEMELGQSDLIET